MIPNPRPASFLSQHTASRWFMQWCSMQWMVHMSGVVVVVVVVVVVKL